MNIEIYHQLGFRSKWNLESLIDDHVGEGVILSPSHQKKTEIELLPDSIKQISIFDPQFFIPNVQKGKLKSYSFFPDIIADGFNTSEYHGNYPLDSAIECVKFQKINGFRRIIIPTRYMSGMSSNFIPQQQELFVIPFLEAIKKLGKDRPVLLQLVVNKDMIKDAEFSNDLLNWITGIFEIDGVYLIADTNPRRKQINDIDFLYSYMRFIDVLVVNELYVLLGYLNTEAVLLTLASPNGITVGSYENLRMFNIRNFATDKSSPTRLPNARLYVSRLFQWIDTNYLIPMNRVFGNADFFDNNYYTSLIFTPSFSGNIHRTELYKHYFLVFSQQLKYITSYDDEKRYHLLCELIEEAINYFQILQNHGVILDQDSDGSHLPAWLTAANLFAADQGWR